jgi:HlyD family secretion protein
MIRSKTLRPIMALTLALTLAACGKPPAASNEQAAARAVRVVQVVTRVLNGGLETSGLLVAREEAAVSAEQLLNGYRVARVLVEPDALVIKGQPLAQLDDTLLQSQINQQVALVAQQQAAADQAAEQAANVAGLDGQGVLSTEQIAQRRYQARSARAALEAQQAQLADLNTRESRMIIRAPVAGLVLDRNVRPGDIAGTASTPMFTMARDGLIELEAQVAEGDLYRIKVGDVAQVVLPDTTTLPGAVRLIYPSVDSQTKLGKVRITLPVRGDLRPGGFGRAVFTSLTRTVTAIPETAVRYDADGASVMVLGRDNRVRQVIVKTGQHANGYVELLQGPPLGAWILLAGATFVLPGDLVQPIWPEAQTSGGR